jgi:CBS domain-containing protein
LCIGLVALQLPQIMGIGYETIEAMLQDVEFSLRLLVILLLTKLIVTAISLGSGLVGGVFAPAMFLGASLGAAYGKILAAILPATTFNIAAPPAYAMVGMAAVLAGTARAPLTSVLLMFELTRDYRIVLPLMAAVGLSMWLVERLKPTPKNQNLQQLELNVEKDPNLEILAQITVAEAMQQPAMLLNGSLSVLEAGLALTAAQCRSALVVNEAEELLGIVTLQDIDRAISLWERSAIATTDQNISTATNQLAHQQLTDICTAEILYAYQDESVAEALGRMAARGLHQLPVIDRQHPKQIIGVLEQDGIALAGNLAGTRQALLRHLPIPQVAEKLPLPELQQLV